MVTPHVDTIEKFPVDASEYKAPMIAQIGNLESWVVVSNKCSSLPGSMIEFDEPIFSKAVETTN